MNRSPQVILPIPRNYSKVTESDPPHMIIVVLLSSVTKSAGLIVRVLGLYSISIAATRCFGTPSVKYVLMMGA